MDEYLWLLKAVSIVMALSGVLGAIFLHNTYSFKHNRVAHLWEALVVNSFRGMFFGLVASFLVVLYSLPWWLYLAK